MTPPSVNPHTNKQVNSAPNNDEAHKASKAAKWSNIVGITIGVILLVVAVAIIVVYYTVIFPRQSFTTTTFG